MTYPILSVTEDMALMALRSFLSGIVAPGVEIVKGQVNRVAEPIGAEFIVMTPMGQERLSTNNTTYEDIIFAGSIAPGTATFTGTITPSTSNPGRAVLVASAVTGTIAPGGALSGPGVASGTLLLSQISGTVGGTGSYYVSLPQTIASAEMSEAYGLLDVTEVVSGEIQVGCVLTDGNWPNLITPWTLVTGFGTGIGNTGTYYVGISQTIDPETIYAGKRDDLVPTQWTVQLDVHGPGSGNSARIIEGLFRSEYAVQAFDAALPGYEVVPLYCENPKQMPFINAENAWEYRWVVDAKMQMNPVIGTIQQFFDQIKVTAIEVDAAYPPG